MEIGRFAFLSPFLGGLGATYNDYFRLIGKRVVDFLFNWTFFARCYGWGANGEYPLKIGDFAPTGSVDPKLQVEGVAPTNHSSSQKTRLNDLSYGIKIWTEVYSILSQSTRLTDRRTDRRTDRQLSHHYRVCIPCSAVKIKLKLHVVSVARILTLITKKVQLNC